MADPIVVPLWVPIATAAIGALTVGIFNFATNWQNKKFEERKYNKELMLNTALEEWKQSCTFCIEQMKLGKSVTLLPLDVFIIHMSKLSEVLMDSKITKHNVSEKLREVHDIGAAVEAFLDRETEREKELIAKNKTMRSSE